MKFPTHYLRPAEGQVFKNNAPWLVYGWQTSDGKFTAVDGRKYPAELAAPIGEPPAGENGTGVEP